VLLSTYQSGKNVRACYAGAPKWEWPSNFSDSVLWNAKVVPYLKTTILGAIWYQGEANAGQDGRQYNCSFQAMIEDWRLKWTQVCAS
jgi:sialate O-acetylesterase